MRVFSRIVRDAKAWIDAPRAETLDELRTRAAQATADVPESRRGDWEKLLAGFAPGDDDRKRRARVEGLLRASRLFDKEERARARLAVPLEWTDPVEKADGLGPTTREKLAPYGVGCVADLVWTLPRSWDDMRSPIELGEALARARDAAETLAPPPRQCVRVVVRSASLVPMRGRRAVRVVLGDARGGKDTVDGWWFYAAHGILSLAKTGQPCLLVGSIRVRDGKRPSVAHPDLIRDEPSARAVRARYPVVGVAPGILRRAVQDAMARTTPLPDPIPPSIAEREAMPAVEPLLRVVHGTSPENPPEDARRCLAERLAWVEAFTRVWQRLRAEAEWGGAKAPALVRDEKTAGDAVASLGFPLTSAQSRAVETIGRDLASTTPMRRLLLGDVGTGKTAVALLAAAQCVAAGHQCALLAPTGVLVDQYADAVRAVAEALGARVERVVAGMRAAERRAALQSVASGQAQIAIGTHALLADDVTFARLGLVVVDEQQRLGVAQRLAMVRKGVTLRPHLLSLSATPIPRTLALALRGELDSSILDERPRGRTTPATELVPRRQGELVLQAIRGACERGERVFFVCPRIEDEEEEETGVAGRSDQIARAVPSARVASVHGAMPAAERGSAMRAFRSGTAQVLVGTTVLEVGLDVPEATLMIVDGAERFGLAQLHQLRGRVGRGDRPGRCLLLHDEPLGDLALRRLQTLVRTTEGADVARADLALRGAGDLGGTRQSGAVDDFLWLDPDQPPPWIERVETDARDLLGRDPELASPEHLALGIAVRRFALALAVREEAG